MANNYHQVLGVSVGASRDTIKTAFRRLVRRYHPDLSREENATEKFVEVVQAYKALTDGNIDEPAVGKYSTKYSSTDAAPAASSAATFKATSRKEKNTVSDEDIKKVDGKDCEISTYLSVEELYWGTELKLNTAMLCPGRREKKTKRPALLKLKIHRGTPNGSRLCLRGKGEAGKNGGANGDIYVTVKLKAHDRYRVEGDNLYVDMPLSAWEAKQGAVVDLVTPAGRIEVDVPAGIASGQSVRIPRRGLPHVNSDNGDLFAVARLVSSNDRTQKLRKWPHLMHENIKHWRPAAGSAGNTIDVRV